MYGFDVPRARAYLYRYLDDLLEDDSLIQASTDFIEDMFSNETLRYIFMDIRLQYLIRWTEYNMSERKLLFPQLFASLRHNQLSVRILQAATARLGLLDCINSALLTNRLEHIQIVVIIPSSGNHTQWYDLCNDHWLKPPISMIMSIVPEHNSYSIAYSKQSSSYGLCSSSKIKIIDASTNTSRTVQLEKMCEGFTSVCANASTVFAYVYKMKIIRDKTETTFRGGRPRYRTSNKLHFYIGTLEDKSSDVIMQPLFTLYYFGVYGFYINENDVCAILFDKKIVIFDTRSCQMETLEFKAMKQSCVVPSAYGFVIHDDITAICIQNVQGQSLGCRYILRNFNLPQNAFHSFKYRLVGDIWFRFRQLTTWNDTVLERSCERFNLCQVTDLSTWTWQKCTVPPNEPLAMFEYDTAAIVLTVPMKAVRCHIQCPHCETIDESSDELANDNFDDAVRPCAWKSDSEESEDGTLKSYNDGNYYRDSYFDIEDTSDHFDCFEYYYDRYYTPYIEDKYEYDDPDLWN